MEVKGIFSGSSKGKVKMRGEGLRQPTSDWLLNRLQDNLCESRGP